MVSRIARISVLFSKTFAYNTLNLITCMHQEKIPNFVKIPMGNTGEIIQIEYKNKTKHHLVCISDVKMLR